MPEYDLKDIRVAEYNNAAGVISYSNHQSVGDAMNVNIALKFAEGRLYSKSRLSNYKKKPTGGSISIATKYIPKAAAAMMYGATETSRSIGGSTVTGIKYTGADKAKYVGVTAYTVDDDDGEDVYTAFFASKALFGPPSWNWETVGESIKFNTPTSTGEIMASDCPGLDIIEFAECADEDEAIAWCREMLGEVVIDPATASYSKAKTTDVTVTISAPSGVTLSSVSLSGTAVTSSNYTFSSGTLTLKSTYLTTLNNGAQAFTITMSNGKTVTLTVTVGA